MPLSTLFIILLCFIIVGLLIYNDKLHEGKSSSDSLLKMTQEGYNVLVAEKNRLEKDLAAARVSSDETMTILRELVRLERIREINPEEYRRGRDKAWAIACHLTEQELMKVLGPCVLFPTLGHVVSAQKEAERLAKTVQAAHEVAADSKLHFGEATP